MTQAPNKLIRIKTAGYSDTDDLAVDVGPGRCGDIKDGVVFSHDREGAWCIAWKDFVRIYEEAKAVRAQLAGAVTKQK